MLHFLLDFHGTAIKRVIFAEMLEGLLLLVP